MLEKDKIDRINALSRKKKTEGLTGEELIEQESLRKQYLASFRSHMKNTIENTTVLDPQGKDITPHKIKKARKTNEIDK